jgi:hypothetical protein
VPLSTDAKRRRRNTALSNIETTTTPATRYSKIPTTRGSPIHGTPKLSAASIA